MAALLDLGHDIVDEGIQLLRGGFALAITHTDVASLGLLSAQHQHVGHAVNLLGFTDLVTEAVGAPCYVADDPIECVAKGVAKAFDYTDDLLDGFEKISLYRYK